MCSISGFNFKNEDFVLKMNKVTSHRGPDGSGIFCNEEISLGHNRLSIIDLSEAASQPMKSSDGNLVIVFNGEIYNFKELKRELADTYQFKTSSDTEVVMAAYQKLGKDCVKKFNGIFAFAIWNNIKKELFLTRDHIGVKPLYYFWDGKQFIFSSEIKAILAHNIPRVLNKEAFNHYLRVLYVPEPLTMFEGIKKLPSASRIILKNSTLRIEKYWEPGKTESSDLPFKKNFKHLSFEIERLVESSVFKQLVSDKPLGVYLSGGVDSSIVLDCVSKYKREVDTFSVGFELSKEDEREKFNQDFYLAAKTSKYYKTNHHEILFKPEEVLELLEKAVWHLDEPISNPTVLPMMKLAAFAKKKVDVVMGGDGGDELFGGYERYRLSLISDYYRMLPFFLRSVLSKKEKFKKLNIKGGIDRFALFMFQKDDLLKKVVNDNFLLFNTKEFFNQKYFNDNFSKKFEEVFMDTDRRSWLVDQSLMMTDKMTMSTGLEARVPFLNKDLVEFSVRIPLKYKVSPFNAKIILKEAFKKRIPSYLLNQPKRGWFSPAAKWLRYPEFYKSIQGILSENYYSETKYLFNWDNVRDILDNHVEKREYNLNIIWSILVFQKWIKMYNIKINL